MEQQRKKKSGRFRRRMRGALAKLGRPMGRRLARDHVIDEAQEVLVSNEQQPEVELDIVASTSKLEVVNPSSDRPAKKKSIFVKLRNVSTRFRRHKSTSGSGGKGQSDRKEYETTPEVNNTTTPATSCSGLSESELDRLIEVDEAEVETSIANDVTSAEGPSSSAAGPEVDQTVGDAEKVVTDRNVEGEVAKVKPEDDDVIREHGDAKKHRKRKRAKRYAKRVRIFNGINSHDTVVFSKLLSTRSIL